jgi:hypothetical protein
MTKIYTTGCVKCGEFHAFKDHDQAEASIDKLRARNPANHDHDGLAIVQMNEKSIPMWGD